MGLQAVLDIALLVTTTILALLSLIVLIRSMLDDLVKKSIYEFNILNEGLCFNTPDSTLSCHSTSSIYKNTVSLCLVGQKNHIRPHTKIDTIFRWKPVRDGYIQFSGRETHNPCSEFFKETTVETDLFNRDSSLSKVDDSKAASNQNPIGSGVIDGIKMLEINFYIDSSIPYTIKKIENGNPSSESR